MPGVSAMESCPNATGWRHPSYRSVMLARSIRALGTGMALATWGECGATAAKVTARVGGAEGT